ncbi:MAG: acetyl-CoA C-acyltransferase [Bdellovibrionota bacterium]
MAVAVIAGTRTPFTKMGTSLRNCSAIELGQAPVNALAEKFNLGSDTRGLVVFGAVIQHPDVSNIAREIVLESKLHPQTRAFSTIMACATSLSSVAEAAGWISRGAVSWAIAGGAESMSNFPVSFPKPFGQALGDLQFSKTTSDKIKSFMRLRPKHLMPQIPPVAERLTGLSMGEHCELMVKEWSIPRPEQDEWAVQTHSRAAKFQGWHEKFFTAPAKIKGAPKDNLIRGDTSYEKISKLKPAFTKDGTITAANASPLTDGGAAVLLADEDFARSQGWPVLAILDDFEMAAVDIRYEGLLMAPPYAIHRLLSRQKRTFEDFDVIEMHEAFAAQVLCNLRALANPEWCKKRLGGQSFKAPSHERINPKGGSIPLGHPFGATGARLVMNLATQIQEEKIKRGMISICAAGGLGFVATLKAAE